jgi:hypothetical protein
MCNNKFFTTITKNFQNVLSKEDQRGKKQHVPNKNWLKINNCSRGKYLLGCIIVKQFA